MPFQPQENRFADLPYFWGLASMTIYIGAHRGLNAKQRQQISIKEGLLAPVAASGGRLGVLRRHLASKEGAPKVPAAPADQRHRRAAGTCCGIRWVGWGSAQ